MILNHAVEHEMEDVFYLREDWVRRNVLNRIGESVLRGAQITVIEKDAMERLWVGTRNQGIIRFEDGLTAKTDVLSNGIRWINDLEFDPCNGRFFVATNSGLAVFDNGSHRMVSDRDGLIDNRVTHLELDKKDLLLSTESGISIFDIDTMTCRDSIDHLANNHIYCTEIMHGNIYLGTYHGLKIIEHGRLSRTLDTFSSPLTNNWITALLYHDGNLYIGTYGGGLFVYDIDHRLVSPIPEIGKCEINFNAICADQNNVYMGTLAHGLIIYNPTNGKIKRLTGNLPSSNVTAVSCDDAHVYIGTENGLARIGKTDVVPV